MDGDGEDRPEDLVRLIEAAAAPGFSAIIFAERTRRLEGPTFRFLYLIYRLLHFVLTGYTIRFGNFSIIPGSLLEGLTVDPNLWLHYAASAVSGGVPYTTIPTSRGRRIEGRSKLGLSGLVRHGLTALCCYDRVMSVRLMVGAAVLNAAILIFVLAGALLEMYLPLALPRPLVLEGGLVGFLCADVLLAVSLGAVFLIRQRKSILTPPLQEYRGLIERIDKIR
jgi:hypothetical protein